jgi:hypothetical protein
MRRASAKPEALFLRNSVCRFKQRRWACSATALACSAMVSACSATALAFAATAMAFSAPALAFQQQHCLLQERVGCSATASPHCHPERSRGTATIMHLKRLVLVITVVKSRMPRIVRTSTVRAVRTLGHTAARSKQTPKELSHRDPPFLYQVVRQDYERGAAQSTRNSPVAISRPATSPESPP